MASYEYWQKALTGEFTPIHDGDAQPGFYRKRTGKAAGYAPVAIWEHEGKILALVGNEPADPAELWSYVADKPITEQQYRNRVATGKWWDEDENVTASLAHDTNNAIYTDGPEIMRDQIETALNAVKTYAEVKDDETAAKAQSARSRLLELSREADKKREVLVRPHLDAQKSVNDEWMPLVKSSKTGADAILTAINAHETRVLNAAKAAAAEQAKKDAEEYAKSAPIGAALELMPVAPQVQQVAAAPIKGAYGRAASRKLVKVAAVKDQDAAYKFLRGQPDLVALILKLSQKMVDGGFTVPGVEVTEEVSVR